MGTIKLTFPGIGMDIKQILVIDNNKLLLRLMTDFLSKEGHEVVGAENGFEALEYLTDFIPDIIFIDLIMPKIGGASLCRMFRNMPQLANSYLVIVSAIAVEQQPDLPSIGADACIAKGPFKTMSQHLLDTIRESNESRKDKETVIKGADSIYPRQITRELLNQNYHHQEILKGVSQGVLEIDSKRVVYANPAALFLLRLTLEKLFGARLDHILELQVWEKISKAIERCGGRDVTDLEQSSLKVFGRHIILQCLPLDAKKECYILLLTDVTEREHAEERARVSAERIKTFFSSVNDAIFVHPLLEKGVAPFIEVNDVACRRYGYSRDEFLKLTVMDIIKKDDTKVHRIGDLWKQLIKEGRLVFETVHIKKTGECYPVEISSNIVEQSGQPVILAVVRDITERKNAQKEKEKLEAQLQQAQKMDAVGRLAGGVAHDFNNMLSVILGFTEMSLKEVEQDVPLYTNLLKIQKAAEHSADLTRQLLAFARKQTISPRVLNLNHIIDKMLDMLRRLIGEDINLEYFPSEELWSAKIDPAQVNQILVNLCINARDAISGGGNIVIATRNTVFDEKYCHDHPGFIPGEYVSIGVSDNGCGVDKEILHLIFEPFFTTKSMGEGTGLGLATVYGILKQNNGFINVESEIEVQTTFTIYVPRVSGKVKEGPKELKERIQYGNEMILVVEDETTILDMLRVMLKKMGYRVLTANTPGEAMRLVKHHREGIDLVITDVVMPEMNGLELVKKLQTSCPDLKSLFTSGYTPNVIAHHGVIDEELHFIQKPFSQDELARKVRESLENDR